MIVIFFNEVLKPKNQRITFDVILKTYWYKKKKQDYKSITNGCSKIFDSVSFLKANLENLSKNLKHSALSKTQKILGSRFLHK